MKRLVTIPAVLALLAFPASPGGALTLTGNESDFPITALIEDDGGDTQLFDCGSGPVNPLDIGRVYCLVENDTLYIGLQYNRYCFCDIQIGIALETGAGGNVQDPFNRQIVWGTNGSALPDYVIYDVIPTNCNGFNYEVVYKADGSGGWTNLGDGSNAWNFFDADGGDFKEFCLPLATLGIPCNTTIRMEAWITQDDFGSGTKPAFDLVFNDAFPSQQKSSPGSTHFDVPDGEESLPESYSPGKLNECPVAVSPSTWGAIKNHRR